MRKYRSPASRFKLCAGNAILEPQITTLVLKAPNLTFDYHTLGLCGVPVSVVYPVRDPRSVVASMMRLQNEKNHADFASRQLQLLDRQSGSNSDFSLEREMLACESKPIWIRCANVWKIKSGLAPKFQEAKLAVYQFRYEDLIRRREIVGELLRHCGLSGNGAALNPASEYKGKGPGGTDRTRSIDDQSIQNWSDCLDLSKEVDVMQASHPLAKRFGYL
jgi:hypothetical protein